MSHYFDAKPDAPHSLASFNEEVGGVVFQFISDSGTFSRKGLDFGSRLLCETAIEYEHFPQAGRVLDLGCGWGPVGTIIKQFYPEVELSFSDVNERALNQAKVNFANNHADMAAEFYLSDGLKEIPGKFNAILLNPPIRAGKSVVHRLYSEAYAALVDEGMLIIVIRKKQGADSTKKELESLFGDTQVDDIARKSGFRIILAEKDTSVSKPEGT